MDQELEDVLDEATSLIEAGQKDLADLIRDLVRAQIELWKQVPSFALLADGITGWNSEIAQAYHNKLWLLHGNRDVHVNLETGELQSWGGREVSDRELIAMNPESFDAAKIIAGLKEHAAISPTRAYNEKMAESNKAHRLEIARELGIELP